VWLNGSAHHSLALLLLSVQELRPCPRGKVPSVCTSPQVLSSATCAPGPPMGAAARTRARAGSGTSADSTRALEHSTAHFLPGWLGRQEAQASAASSPPRQQKRDAALCLMPPYEHAAASLELRSAASRRPVAVWDRSWLQ
jgi:hypothetical protein